MKILLLWDIRKGIDSKEKGRARTALHRAIRGRQARSGKQRQKFHFPAEAFISPSVLLLDEKSEGDAKRLEREFSKWFEFKSFRVE